MRLARFDVNSTRWTPRLGDFFERYTRIGECVEGKTLRFVVRVDD